jgi:predicted RNase H-like HicB family nuclease
MLYTELMLCDYIRVTLEHAHYELIEDAEPFYGEVPELKGVWATGETLEACRNNLESTIEGWLSVCLARNLNIPNLY